MTYGNSSTEIGPDTFELRHSYNLRRTLLRRRSYLKSRERRPAHTRALGYFPFGITRSNGTLCLSPESSAFPGQRATLLYLHKRQSPKCHKKTAGQSSIQKLHLIPHRGISPLGRLC